MPQKPSKLPQQQRSYSSTPIKIAVLIDGGFFIKRYNSMYNKGRTKSPDDVANDMYTLAHNHVGKENYLYRIFYYDCLPFDKKAHNPISKKCIDFSKTPEANFRIAMYESLKQKRKVALRLGYIKESHEWKISNKKLMGLIKREITIDDIKAEDLYYELKQKAIDIKIGVDIASMALKKFVDRIVLISGDADFVPASKLARREGIDFILDPMGSHIDPSLFEHIDGKKSPKIFQGHCNK